MILALNQVFYRRENIIKFYCSSNWLFVIQKENMDKKGVFSSNKKHTPNTVQNISTLRKLSLKFRGK